jgi:hypothetical protein
MSTVAIVFARRPNEIDIFVILIFLLCFSSLFFFSFGFYSLAPARAAYSDADVFILDDPFSAVDATVGETLFHACLRGLLRAKTVLLVTNQVCWRRWLAVHCFPIHPCVLILCISFPV